MILSLLKTSNHKWKPTQFWRLIDTSGTEIWSVFKQLNVQITCLTPVILQIHSQINSTIYFLWSVKSSGYAGFNWAQKVDLGASGVRGAWLTRNIFSKPMKLFYLKEYIHRNSLIRRPALKSPYDRKKMSLITMPKLLWPCQKHRDQVKCMKTMPKA